MKETRVSLLITTALLSLADLSARLGYAHSPGSQESGLYRLGVKSLSIDQFGDLTRLRLHLLPWKNTAKA